MIRAFRAVWFLVFTFVGLLLLGASFWRALLGTLALLLLRITPVAPAVVFGIGAAIFGLGILQWSTGIVFPR
jgi:hypothetical protein